MGRGKAKKGLVIHVLVPGGYPGKTAGDVIENPTPNDIQRARSNPSCLRVVETEVKPASRGGSVEREVDENAADSSENSGDRQDI